MRCGAELSRDGGKGAPIIKNSLCGDTGVKTSIVCCGVSHAQQERYGTSCERAKNQKGAEGVGGRGSIRSDCRETGYGGTNQPVGKPTSDEEKNISHMGIWKILVISVE